MRISELSETTGVPVGTIKFYLREGLLPAGQARGPRRAEYSEHHVQRLRLIKTLRDVADTPVDTLRAVTTLLDTAAHTPETPATEQLIRDALATRRDTDTDVGDAARSMTRVVLRTGGWTGVRPDSPAVKRLGEIVESLMADGVLSGPAVDILSAYVDFAARIAAFDAKTLAAVEPATIRLEQSALQHVALGELLLVLRSIAAEHGATPIAAGAVEA